MLILALDCSTARGSVAVGDREEGSGSATVLWERFFPAGRGHGGELFSTVQEGWLAAAGVGRGGPGKIVVGLGPGSYSGARQAIALATGLALATGAALVGVPSVLALEEPAPRELSCHIVGDARRGTFYYSRVEGRRLLHGPELLPDTEALCERLAIHPDWPVRAAESVPPSLPAGVVPVTVFPVAARLLDVCAEFEVRGVLEPIYLRPPAITPGRVPATIS